MREMTNFNLSTKLCLVVIAWLLVGCGQFPLLSEEKEVVPQFKELTPQNLQGQWVHENKRVRISFGDGGHYHQEYNIRICAWRHICES